MVGENNDAITRDTVEVLIQARLMARCVCVCARTCVYVCVCVHVCVCAEAVLLFLSSSCVALVKELIC